MWYFCQDHDNNSHIFESDSNIGTFSSGTHFWSVCPYKTLDDLLKDIHDKVCIICDNFIRIAYQSNEKLIKNQMCFSCNLWYERSLCIKENNMIVNGKWYSVNKDESTFFKGFGGAKFIFIKNGKLIESNNVWFGGDIPKIWLPKILDNANMITGRIPLNQIT